MSPRQPISRRQALRAALLAPLALAACGSQPAPVAQTAPTVAPFFQQPGQVGLVPTPRPQRITPGGQAGARQTTDQFDEFVIFDEVLHEDWTFEHSSAVRYDIESRHYAYSGDIAAAVTPLAAAGDFFVAVREGARQSYLRERIAGVSVRLSGGSGAIDPQDLGMRVTGSNARRHWVPNDTSTQIGGRDTAQGEPTFLYSRLYFLDINRAIRPETWVEVVNWLDDRIYDPKYDYLTGFAIQNDDAFLNTYYVDRITLLLHRA